MSRALEPNCAAQINFDGQAHRESGRKTINNQSKFITQTGIVLIIITGIIHFIDAPDAFGEITYKGVLFTLNGLGALVAAYGIFRGASWGWILGLLIAGGAIIGYIISRTVGLPGLEVDPEWLEPIGVVSLIAEGIFVALAVKVLTNNSQGQVLIKNKKMLPTANNKRRHFVAPPVGERRRSATALNL